MAFGRGHSAGRRHRWMRLLVKLEREGPPVEIGRSQTSSLQVSDKGRPIMEEG